MFFFVGLFVMVGALEETGAIKEVADAIAAVTNGDRTAELLGITWVSAIGSGIIDNIPFTATMIPVVEQLQSGNEGDDAYWWALSLGACFGGNLTLIAAAANVAAAGMAERAGRPIGFMTFRKVGVPATLVSMLLATGYIALRYLYLTTLGYAGFIPRSLDEALEKRATCASEPVSAHMNTDHIDVGEDFSDTQLAEIFLRCRGHRPVPHGHHRVLIVPIVDKGRVTGIVTREDFTRALAQRLLALS